MNKQSVGLMTVKSLASLVVMLVLASVAFGEVLTADRRITWQGNVGIPGGIPARTTIYQTIAAGASMSAIQTALNSCPADQTVKLSAGTYTISGTLVIPSRVTLRGSGAGVTILNGTGSGEGMIRFGTSVQGEYVATAHNITSGYDKGSTSIVLNNTTSISVGSLLILDQLNDSALVSNQGTYGTINWNSRSSGTRALGQTVEVTGISGTTVTFSPPMYYTYKSSLSPQAMSFSAGCQYGGLENLTLKANNSGYTAMFLMNGSKYCWVKGIENDYCDGDHGQIGYGAFRCEVRDSYFHDAYDHDSGSTDSDLMIHSKASANLIENNIFYRMHTSIMLNWGASGNVIAYNYSGGNFHSPAENFMIQDMSGNHGAHPMFNLWEGNIGNLFHEDSYWGSSSHNTYLRNWGMGDALIFPPYSGRGAWQTNNAHHATQALRAFAMDYQQKYGNWIGNIAGCDYTKDHDVRQVITPQSRPYQTTVCLFSLGYGDSSDSGSGGSPNLNAPVYTTLVSHGNYDTADGSVVWQSGISDQTIPSSYYLSSKPAFFGNLAWPPINPQNPKTAAAAITNLPAAYRFVHGTTPPAGTGNQPPVAVASASVLIALPLIAINFSSAGSYDPEGTALSYSWSFGDGTTSTAANPSHSFAGVGAYTVTLTVSDGVNSATATTLAININLTGGNQAPTAVAGATPTSGAAPLAVAFSSTGSSDPEGTTLTYSWTFGDGTTSTAANPSKTYSTAGSYVARLVVSDGVNTNMSSNINITVTATVNQPPVAVASATHTSGAAPLAVAFSSAGSSDPNGTPLSYSWNFGDGTTSTAANPSRTYTNVGTYTAQLTVSDGTNAAASSAITITTLATGSGLVAAYGFEETSGTTVNDATTYANRGTLTSVTRTAGKYGQGLAFSSASAVVTVSNSPSLQLDSAMTLEAWVNPSSTSGDKNIIYKDTWSYCLAGSSSDISAPNLSGSFAPEGVYGPGSLPTNAWTHVAGTYDGTTLRLYTNGVLIASQTQAGTIGVTAGSLMIGGNSLVSGKAWTGLIDEVRIYDRALSAAEIQADMALPVVSVANTAPLPPQGLRIVP